MAAAEVRLARQLSSALLIAVVVALVLLAPGAGGTRRKLPASASKQARNAFMQWFRQIGGTAEDIALEQVTASGGMGIVASKDIDIEVRQPHPCISCARLAACGCG
jgi:hypothetical protein